MLPPGSFLEFGLTSTFTVVGSATPSFVFNPVALPTDGIDSLTIVGGVVQVAVASPTNFAGQTATMHPACSDGIDDDGDGFFDYPADPGCFDPSGTIENGSDLAIVLPLWWAARPRRRRSG